MLLEDEFRRRGVKIGFHDPDILLEERVANLLSRADTLVGSGPSVRVPPQINQKGQPSCVRGILCTGCAVTSTEPLIAFETTWTGFGVRSTLLPHCSLLVCCWIEWNWHAKKLDAATNDFSSAERHVSMVLEDPARKFSNIQLWFNCARHLTRWNRQSFLTHLHQLHEYHPGLDSSFLIMCLYLADAVQTGSVASWRKYEEFQAESARRSANLAIRT